MSASAPFPNNHKAITLAFQFLTTWSADLILVSCDCGYQIPFKSNILTLSNEAAIQHAQRSKLTCQILIETTQQIGAGLCSQVQHMFHTGEEKPKATYQCMNQSNMLVEKSREVKSPQHCVFTIYDLPCLACGSMVFGRSMPYAQSL